METVIVDIFDFMSCFSSIDGLVRKRQAANQTVAINISGGLWLLSDAAMMAALNNGCESYYIDDMVKKMPVMLPVLKVTIGERLTARSERHVVGPEGRDTGIGVAFPRGRIRAPFARVA